MTVAELRELLLEYPQDAVVVRWSEPACDYRLMKCEHIYLVGNTDEGLFSVPMVHIS